MRKSKNITELNDSFMDIFSYVLHLKNECEKNACGKGRAFELLSFEKCHRQMCDLFDNSSELTQRLGIDSRKYDQARYAVCAWADEILSNMSWSYARLWRNHTLLKEYYGSVDEEAGFYTRLNALQPEDYAVREIYLYCLYLGYCGPYAFDHDQPLLTQLKTSHLHLLVNNNSQFNTLQDSSIFRNAYPYFVPENTVAVENTGKPNLLILLAAILPLIAFIAYFALSIAMDRQINSLAIYLAEIA